MNNEVNDDPAALAGTLQDAADRGAFDPAATRSLTRFLRRHSRIALLSGAGLSTGSGIPDYRDAAGNWKHAKPVQFADFRRSASVRQRYWAGSFGGWKRITRARPNAAHEAIARLEHSGRLSGIITQNVDNLHRRAGSRNVVDLHGTLERVVCLQCRASTARREFQLALERLNPHWDNDSLGVAPDGDSVPGHPTESFVVPECRLCGGTLKPDVVFFGEAVPKPRILHAERLLQEADSLLVVGSSLMVFSGFRFARMAVATGIPIAIVNRGVTRADDLATWRYSADCAALLPTCIAAVCNA